jgi:ubiquinone/menaquinone biosynthesis C-methylase UbiE
VADSEAERTQMPRTPKKKTAMNFGTAQIIQGNALHLPLADNNVDLICTSPP